MLDQLYPRVKRLVNSQTRTTDIVDGVVQDTFLILLKKLRKGEPEDPAKIESYTLGIAKFTLIARCRLMSRLSETEMSETLFESGDSTPLNFVMTEEMYMWIEQSIDRLSKERDRELMRIYLAEELGTNDLCELIKVSRDHLYRVLYRAKKRLGDILAEGAGMELLKS
ncbi:MAG: sigma-70 family RNA polymerase sigma factor [Pseudomonadota bacterium]